MRPLTILDRVWSQLASSLGNLRSIFTGNEPVATGLKKFVLNLVTPAAEEIGWEFKEGEDYLTGQLRRLLISVAGQAGHTGQVFGPHYAVRMNLANRR
jgi:hypothetical protein